MMVYTSIVSRWEWQAEWLTAGSNLITLVSFQVDGEESYAASDDYLGLPYRSAVFARR